jgi:hypothetical protein
LLRRVINVTASLPSSKRLNSASSLVAIGGDAKHPLAAYGYAIQAREGLARVFEKRIERGDMDEVLAKDAARAIMLTNGCELHGVPLPEAG